MECLLASWAKSSSSSSSSSNRPLVITATGAGALAVDLGLESFMSADLSEVLTSLVVVGLELEFAT